MNAYTPSATSEVCPTVKNGIFYTPDNVAKELACGLKSYFTSKTPLSVLDPACGDGALLRAVKDEFGSACNFQGCDLFEPDPQHWVDGMRFNKGDFFQFEHPKKFDLVVTNPPYIQFGRLDQSLRRSLHQRFSSDAPFRATLDLWAYFLLKSISHLKKGGCIAAVIPWSFLEAEFSHELRYWLAGQFSNIQVLVLRDRHFSTTEKRVLMLWMTGYGESAKSIQIGFSERIDDNHNYHTIDQDEWRNSAVLSSVDTNGNKILAQCRESGWLELGSISKVGIGLVTGANKFFIRQAGQHFVKQSLPIFTKVSDLTSLEVASPPGMELLLLSPEGKPDAEYIHQGVLDNIHKRSHCLRRGVEWYKILEEPIPDAFFTYRVASIPYLALNPDGFQCTNTLHRVSFFENISENQKKWIAIHMLSDITQLSLEMNGRHYGNGVLKIEPSALKAALVYLPSRRISKRRFDKISRLIGEGQKEEAAAKATEYCKEVGCISEKLWDEAKVAIDQIRARRK